MFQIVVEVLLAGLTLFAFLAAIFWFGKKTGAAPAAGSEERGRGPESQQKPER